MFNTIQIWAFRDLLRRPFESLLLGITLTLTVAILGTLLLFPRALHDTLNTLLKATPAIILRRIDATGFSPLPVKASVLAAENVIGVVSVRPRIWGVVNGPNGPLTIVGILENKIPKALAGCLTRLPEPGQVIIGFGVSTGPSADTLNLKGEISRNYQVIDRLPEKTSMFTHDLVLMNPEDARQLIGLPQGYACDLAIDVFHENEQDAILSDLTASFSWPVECVTRLQSQGLYAGRLNRGRTLVAIAVIPGVLALCLLVAVNTRKSMGRQSDLGIMKAMGWTTGDIVRFQLYRELSVCLPSAVVGICLSFVLVYGPGAGWAADFFLGWNTVPPSLYLEPTGAATVVLEMAGLMLVPMITSAFLPALKGATSDVHDMIKDAGSR